jgi:hypothetical protein
MEIKTQKRKKKEEKPLKISGSFNDVLKIAVSDNPKPKKQTPKKKS